MNLDAHWMPFTDTKSFKKTPRMLQSARGMYYQTVESQRLLDMTAGLWCVNLGHGNEHVAAAIADAARELDYAPSFSIGHPRSFQLAERLAKLAPDPLNHLFFTNSGSEAVDTALKLSLAYQVARGKPAKRLFVSRERAYHGVNFGGTLVGGIPNNTRTFGRGAGVDFLPHTLDIKRNAFSRGIPQYGSEKADALEDIVNLHGAENIAAVLVEPIAGAGGVIPPPAGYLKRLREICDRHDLLLIFDEVVCAFGRVGSFTASHEFRVTPDLLCSAKGLTSGYVPMGAVFCSDRIYRTVTDATETGIEFWHGYTYSAHPIACAAALACLDVYLDKGLFSRASTEIGDCFAQALHGMRDLPGVIDIRNYGLLGAIEFEAMPGGGLVGPLLFQDAWQRGLLIRGSGNCVILSPPLIVEKSHIDEFVEQMRASINAVIRKSAAA